MIAMMTVAAWLASVNHVPLPIVEEASAQAVSGAVDPLTRRDCRARDARTYDGQHELELAGLRARRRR